MKMQLSSDEQEERWKLYKRLTAAAQTLDENVVKANALIMQARSCLEWALRDYNNSLADAGAWSGQIAAETEYELSSSSAQFLDDTHRQDYEAWSRRFKEADFSPIHFDFPDRIILEIEDHPALLADLPCRPAGSEAQRHTQTGVSQEF